MSVSTEALEALKKWREEHQGEPIEQKTPWDRIREKPKSMHARIRGFCCNCVGWEVDGERPPRVIENIRGCTARNCTLWDVRPYRGENEVSHFASDAPG